MAHTSANVLVHIVFSTKRRNPSIAVDMKGDLCAYLGGIVRETGGVALIINAMADHVHLLARIPPAHGIAEVVRIVKANSSRWAHEKWPQHRGFAWQTGYGAFSVSQSNVAAVTKYIAEQERHHRTTSFQDEYLQFLRKQLPTACAVGFNLAPLCGLQSVTIDVGHFCQQSFRTEFSTLHANF
jgi:putative transposase